MTDLGCYQQGQELPLVLVTGADPDATPRAVISTAGGAAVVSVPLAADDRPAGTGLFRTPWVLDRRTPAGDYLVAFRWAASGAPRLCVARFRVLPGGSPDGAVISLFPAVRPARTVVLMQTSSGRLIRGLNPEV